MRASRLRADCSQIPSLLPPSTSPALLVRRLAALLAALSVLRFPEPRPVWASTQTPAPAEPARTWLRQGWYVRARPILASGGPAAPGLAPEAEENETLGGCCDFLGMSVGKRREFFEITTDCVPVARDYLLVFSPGFLS